MPQRTNSRILTLFAFALLNAGALSAWFARVGEPWTYKSVVAIASTLGAVTAGAALWRAPTREWTYVGIAALVLSLFRIGTPGEWTTMSAIVFELTVLLLIPIVRAAISYQREP